MKIEIIRRGKRKPETYIIDTFEISNHSESYITLFFNPALKKYSKALN